MQLECAECHRALNLPDQKLPVGRPFSFNCPYCKHKNTAFIPTAGAAAIAPPAETEAPLHESAPAPAPESAPLPPAPPAAEPEAHYAETYQLRPAPRMPESAAKAEPEYPTPSDLAMDEPGLQSLIMGGADERPKALVVYDDEETADMLVRKLDYIGYQASVAVNMRDAAKQLKFVNFSILIIQEDYYGASLNGNHLLRAVQTLDNHSRRSMQVVLISPSMTTLDDLTAFSLSLDAVINRDDLTTIDRILLSIIARGKKFYAVYKEILTEHGLD